MIRTKFVRVDNVSIKVRKVTQIITLGIMLASAESALAGSTFFLDISRHPTEIMTDIAADGILSGASDVLKVDDDGAPGIRDRVCDVTLVRSGSVTTFSTGAPTTINSDSQLTQVFSEPKFVKVVTAINRCGGKTATFSGCTKTTSRTMIVIESTGIPDVVWAHEFGHATGLSHRNDDRALMNATVDSNSRFVNDTECASFLNGPPATTPLVSSTENAQSAASRESSRDGSIKSLLELANSAFVDRFPYALISRGNVGELPALEPLLFDLGRQKQWASIASILGILGEKRHADLLVKFVSSDQVGASASATVRGKTAALIALGHFLSRTGDPFIAGYLLSATSSSFWEAISTAWPGASESERSNRIASMQEAALFALAVSGRPEIAALLPLTASAMRHDETTKAGLLKEASETYAKVRAEGLPRYYE